MLATAAAGTEQATERESPAAAVPKRREPTPDHPPYSWMIGEAIEALSEDGGSAEAAISGLIRARHPGVPAGTAHDRFLRHYLVKHVAEGLFLCAAPGRYSLRPDEPALALEEVPAVKPATAVGSGSPSTEAKRGRGRPRKDGSSPASAAGKKGGGSQSPSATPKRRGRPRVLPLVKTTDVSCQALVTDKKDGGDAPSTTDNNYGQPRELALVIANDGYTTPSCTESDGGEAPSAKLALVAEEDGATAFTTPERSTQPCNLAPVPADEGSAPASVADKSHKKDGTDAPSAKYKRRRRPCTSAPVNAAHGSAPTSTADKDSGKAVPTTPKGRGRQRKPALVAAAATAVGSTPTLVAGKKDRNEALSVPVKPRGQPRKLFLLTADEVPDNQMFCVLALPAQMPAATKA